MAKKKEFIDQTKLIPQLFEDIMAAGFSRYAKYIIQERALPDARDGLKPVQRRILYAMYHDGNTFDKPYRKSAKTVGLVIGNYHPHGDISVYDAMVRMSQDWKVGMPLIDMHGNNGSIDDDPAAAMRYTEARLAKITEEMEHDLDKNTVEMAPNFDDTEVEPTVLPVGFPLMLVNGATGIAAGYATNMPPHNLNEVIDGTIYRIQNPTCQLHQVMEYIQGPDFPTGGIVQGLQGIQDAFSSGKGRIVVRGKCKIEQQKNMSQIIITEIPYEVVKANLVKKMDEIRISKAIDGILDVRDESDRTGLKIVVDVHKDKDPNLILNYLYKNTDLQIYYNYNNVAIIDERPVQVGLLGLMDAFIDFRRQVILRRSQYELDKMENRCHIIEGLMKAVSILDEIIAMIRASQDKADAKNQIMQAFGFDEIQAEAIVTLRLYRLSNTDIYALSQEFASLVNQIEELKTIISSDQVLRSVIISELRKVKQEYGVARKTVIEEEIEEIVIDKMSMITSEQVMVTVSKDGYIKKVSMRSYGAASDQMTGIKEGDSLIGTMEANTLDTLLLFTSKGNYAYVPVWQIEDSKWKDVGAHLNKTIRIDGDDKIIGAILVHSFDTNAYVVTVSSNNKIKKSWIGQYKVERNHKVMPAMSVGKNHEMLYVGIGYPEDEVIVTSREGYSYRFDLDSLSAQNVKTEGQKLMNLSHADRIGGVAICSKEHTGILVFGENGDVKRLHKEEITRLQRASKGTLIAKKNKSNPLQTALVLPCQSIDTISFMDESGLVQYKVSDLPYKDASSYMSHPWPLQQGFQYVPMMMDCKMIELPEQIEKPKDDYEQTTLDFNQ